MNTVTKYFERNENLKLSELPFSRYRGIKIFSCLLAVNDECCEYIPAISKVYFTIYILDSKYYVIAFNYHDDGRKWEIPTIDQRVRKDLKLRDANALVVKRMREIGEIIEK